jgi:hypothetical protein
MLMLILLMIPVTKVLFARNKALSNVLVQNVLRIDPNLSKQLVLVFHIFISHLVQRIHQFSVVLVFLYKTPIVFICDDLL